jgi:hypothetical protein
LALMCTLAACTTDVAGTNDAGVSHAGQKMTAAIRTCRNACWSDIPYNACADQRDACMASAVTPVDQLHCRQTAHACRNIRTTCLLGCWNAQ